MAISIIHKPTLSAVTLYNNPTYQNDVGVDCSLSENTENRFAFIIAMLYVGAHNAANRTMVLLPNYIGSVYLPIMNGTTPGSVRCECTGTKFVINSSSFASVFVESVVGYRIN